MVRPPRRTELLDGLGREIRHAARTLWRTRGFTVMATLTLALGIGATTAIFTLLDAVVLRPLPYPSANRIVAFDHVVPGVGADARWNVSEAEYFYVRRHARSFEEIGVYSAPTLTLVVDGRAERIQGAVVSATLLNVLGARPAHGRLLNASDDRPDGARVVLISHDFWQRRYGGDRAILGRSIELEATMFEIVGVLDRDVELPDLPVDVWRPMGLDSTRRPINSHYLNTVGRLRPGVTPLDAQTELAALIRRFPAEMPSAYSAAFLESTGFTPRVTPLRDKIVGDVGRILWILLSSVGLVLLIACANVANLFLVRAESRRREIAIRSALGAERSHLAWHYVTESLMLALMAAAVGLAFAYGVLRVLLAVAPAGIPRLAGLHIGQSSVVFAGVIALIAGIVFGLFPLARQVLDLGALRDGGRGLTASRGQHAARNVLVVGQIALALVLLAAAGLMLESVRNLRNVRPGLEPHGVVTMDIALPFARYRTYDDVSAFYRTLLTRIEAVPGVEQAGATTGLPLRGAGGCATLAVEDRPPGQRSTGCVGNQLVAPGYFQTMGITVRGTPFTWAESDAGTAGVVVTRALADRLWPGDDPIGKGIRANGDEPPYFRVVAVAMDVREAGLHKPPTESVYFPMRPNPGTMLWSPPRSMTVVVRTRTAQPEAVMTRVREVIGELDPRVPLANVRSMESVVAASMARTAFAMLLLSIAAGMALILSAVGIFGVISYIVSLRRSEIGIRLALGARAAQVSRLIVSQALRLAIMGIVIGLVGAATTTRFLSAMLFEVSPTEPAVLVAVSMLLLGLAALASYVPARRSARVDPAVVLRSE
jgi:predicted permease